jgi:tetratricopeptide (TPR) repeat protein
MKQKKQKDKLNQDTVHNKKSIINLVYNEFYPVKYETFISYFLAGIAGIIGLFFLYQAKTQNGFFCFPLDDSWIHLTFARNIVEYGSFSYYKNQLATSGSTSPLYTFILAGFYFFSKNEFIISYIIGISCFALAVFFTFKLAKLHFGSEMWLAVLVTLLFALQPELNLIAVSGMETTMFIALVIISMYYYKKKNKNAFGIFLGLLLWCRPDGLVVWVAILVDYFIAMKLENSTQGKKEVHSSAKQLITPFSIATGIALFYFLFNFILSGSLLPNTYGSKIAIYKSMSRTDFLNVHVLQNFTRPEFVLYIAPFLLSVVIIINGLVRKRYNEYSIYIIFLAGLIFVYWFFLPFSSSYGRYLIPLIPFYIILAVYGIKIISEYLRTKLKSTVLIFFILAGYFAASITLSIIHLNIWSGYYSQNCKYYNERHVAAGKWIYKNTFPNAVVATHDIGAIEFYGQRKLVDMAGIVSPDIIKKMNAGFMSYLNNYLIEKKVDYVATLKNWCEIVNDNPIFAPVKEPEFLEIYKFKPNKTHILEGQASGLLQRAIQYMNAQDNVNAEREFLQALAEDTMSSRTYYIMGYFYYNSGQYVKGEEYLKKALDIFPDFASANFMMAEVQFLDKNYVNAREYNNKCLNIDPTHKGAIEMVEKLKNKFDNLASYK